jgi:DNA-binding NtrC family response regulator
MSTPHAPHSDPHVLVAHHEPAILGLLTGAFAAAGYQITAVRGLAKSAALLAAPGHGYAAAVLADRSSGPTVRDVLAAARPAHPRLPVVVTAATVDPATAAAVAADPAARLVPKPFRADEVVRAVSELLAAGPGGPRG